jgi:hypothetical protein
LGIDEEREDGDYAPVENQQPQRQQRLRGGPVRARQVQVRDSKDPDGPVLAFTRREWEAFLAGCKDGEFDLPTLRRHAES